MLLGGGASGLDDLTVNSLDFEASLPGMELSAGLSVSGDWSISAGLVTVALTGLELHVFVSPNRISGLLQGRGTIAVPNGDVIELFGQAQYPGTGAWEFRAGMIGTLSLPRLVYGLLGQEPPSWLTDPRSGFDVTLADLGLFFSTAAGHPFSAYGTLGASVGEQLLGLQIRLLLTVDIERRLTAAAADEHLAVALRDTAQVDAQAVTTGSLSGTFSIDKLVVTASVSVTDTNKDFTFAIAYRDVSLRAVTSWVDDPAPRHQVLTVTLAGTLGDLLSYLVSLANPNATFRLDPPWDFLGALDLGGFSLVIDPTAQSVAVTCALHLNLGFVTIESVGLSYAHTSGKPEVKIELAARMVGETAVKPLTWDPVNQAPPQAPGLGDRLVSLRYLGLGQHVSPRDLTEYTSISDVVDALVAAMRPVDPVAGRPPIDPVTMRFDASSQWLLGIDATFMDTVALKLVMHDPDLYGILVALSGPQAGALSGLSVELLYRKVTDDIGVFHARLQVPDVLRKLEFGAVSVTLGVITVDIYTNGDFRVDLGFPAGGDFTPSFAIEAGPYNGRGGLYFGVLSGATSQRVPAVVNGTFSPVIELGVGLSIGVGRTFERGPLKAGLYVNLVVIVEGALAWFHPDNGGQDTELFYWCRGTVGIVGRMYASIDFKIIGVEIALQIAASATVELAAYRATVVSLSLSLRASASVRIAFFTISFSFSLTLQASFTIGSDSTPPWQVAPGTAGRRVLTAARAVVAPAGEYRLRFDPDARVFPGGLPRTAHVSLVPGYTVADVPVDWTGQAAPPNADPGYRLVVMLVTDNAVPVGATTIAETLRPDVTRNALAQTPSDTSFNQLAEGLLRWALDALGVDVISATATVTLAELTELVEQLAMAEAADSGFTWAGIEGFLAGNLHLVVSGTAAGGATGPVSGTPFPMLPVLTWTSTGLPEPDDAERDFATHQLVDATYEAEALGYFADLDPRPPQDRPSPAARLAAAVGGSESMATYVLRDYFRLVARAAAQAAADLLAAYPYEVTGDESLGSVAARFPAATTAWRVTAQDSVENVASRLGLSAAELVAHNPRLPGGLAAARPGDDLAVAVAVTPQSIALANPDWPVADGRRITLGDLPARIGGRTLAGLVRDYRLLEPADEAYPAALTDLLGSLRTTTPLLRTGATVPVPGLAVRTDLPVGHIAAAYWVRLGMAAPVDVPLADWYQRAIDRLNPEVEEPLREGTVLTVPDRYEGIHPCPWTALEGDTLLDVAAYVALVQNVVDGTPFAAWLRDMHAANETPVPGEVALPSIAAAAVMPQDTLASLQTRLLIPQEEFGSYVADADILLPLVTVEVPGAVGMTGSGLTLLALAQRYGLALDDLAGRIAGDAGVLATVAGRPLTVPDVPAATLEDLATAMHDGQAMATVSGQVARFMLGGLRLPAPQYRDGAYRAAGPMTAGYELIGQQVVGPPPPPPPESSAEAEPPVVTVTVAKGPPADWLTFAGPAADSTDATTEAEHAVVSLTGADLREHYPATGLRPVVVTPLAAIALSHDVAVRYPVTQVIPWHTTTEVPLPSPAPSSPTLWPLPADLIARAAADTDGLDVLLEQTTPQTGADAPYTELRSYAWATLVPFTVRRVPGLPGTVEMLGADTVERQRLALLLAHLRTSGEVPEPLTMAWRLPAAPGTAPGLTSTPLDSSGTFIVRTNLTTRTASGRTTAAAAAAATAGRHVASLGDAERFLTLLWECSVVGGGGYWMRFGGDVPEAVFDQDGLAQLSLVVQVASQSDRRLRSFGNVALVGDGVDPATIALTARAVAPGPSDVRRAASVEPGRVGFTLRLDNPLADDTPQGRLRRLYGLLGFRLGKTPAFHGSCEGRPLPPRPADDTDALGLVKATEEAEQTWELTRIVDISRFARSRGPTVPTAPPVEGDPYAGVAAGSGTRVLVRFDDVFGNPSGTADQVDVPVRYTDPVVGVGAWPSTTVGYTVERTDGLPELVVSVDFQAAAYQPGASESGIAAAAAAARGRDQFIPVHYQLAQPDVTATVLTSLQQPPGGDPTPLPADVDLLRRYVTGAHALLDSLATVVSATADAAAVLDDVCALYGVGFEALAAANADTALDRLVTATELQVPVSVVFRTGDTVAVRCAALYPPPDPVAVLLDGDNVVLPLNPGVELTVPEHHALVPAGSLTAAEVAAECGCTLARLVAINRERPGLLTPGFVFECNGLQVAVAADPPQSEATLAGVAFVFQENNVPFDEVRIVALNSDRPGMFRSGASLTVDGYLVVSGDTLADNGAASRAAELAPLNTETADLFPPGSAVFLTTRPTPLPAGETLTLFAEANGTTPGDLLRHNGSVPVSPATPPAVPGMWDWPQRPDEIRVPCMIRAGDSLDAIAVRFPGADLASVNAAMPKTVASGVTVTVAGTPVTTTAASSFAEVCALFDPPVDVAALAAAIGSRTDVLAPGALLVCPPGVLPAATHGLSGVTPRDAARPFGVPAAALLAANAGTPGLLLPDQMLWVSPTAGGDPLTETTTPYDTLTALVERFRRRGAAVGLDALVAGNLGIGFLRPGARVLVPPATARLAGRLGEAMSDGVRWSFPSAVFPLTVALDIARDADLVDPALEATATRATTAVPADRSAGGGVPGTRTLTDFADRVQEAVPGIRLATGQAPDTDVWAVVFGEGGIEKVSVRPDDDTGQPRAYALRPLATTLFGRQGVTTPVLDVTTGQLGEPQPRDYQGIDLEGWARTFLADVELVLSAAYVRGAYLLAPDALDQIAETKRTLASAVAEGLDNVLDLAQPDPAEAAAQRAAAVEALRQELLASLTRGYETSAVLQYDTSVSSPWPDTYARLSGHPVDRTGANSSGGPSATLSNGKIALADGDSQVTFLATVPDVPGHSEVDLTLDLALVEMEFGITPDIEGYERSDWLTFVNQLGSGSPEALHIELGEVRVPVPLRAYPPMPILLDHRAIVPTSPSRLDDAVRWRYQFSVQHQSAEQDTVECTVAFNQRALARAAAQTDDLFAALARYTAVSAPLLDLLAGLIGWEPGDDAAGQVLGHALDAFCQLASDVAAAWGAHWAGSSLSPAAAGDQVGNGPVPDVYRYTLSLSAEGDWYTNLRLTRAAESGPGDVGWPEVVAVTEAGERIALREAADPAACGCSGPDCRCFEFPARTVAAFTALTFELTLPPVHIAGYQSASVRTRVTRNTSLLGEDGPPTRESFVYRTPEVGYSDPIVPSIDITGAVAVDPWPRQPLGPLFTTVFDGDPAGRTIAVGMRYEYTLVPGDRPVAASLPVVQSSTGVYDSMTVPAITSATDEWRERERPSADGGAWAVRLSLYSSLDPSLPRPLLHLRHLVSPLADTSPEPPSDRS